MKILNISFIFIYLIAIVLAKQDAVTAYDYEVTFYGCPHECHTQTLPSCQEDLEPTGYFCALSTQFNTRDYCFDYAVVMPTNGQDKMVKAKIVDECGSCERLHVDLSHEAFTAILPERQGVENIIWGIYSRDGRRLDGPYYNSKVDRAAKQFGISTDSFVGAFDANAKLLAASSDYTKHFDSSIGKDNEVPKMPTSTYSKTSSRKTLVSSTRKVTTTSRTTTKTVRTTTKVLPTTAFKTVPPVKTLPVVNTISSLKTIPTKTLPVTQPQDIYLNPKVIPSTAQSYQPMINANNIRPTYTINRNFPNTIIPNNPTIPKNLPNNSNLPKNLPNNPILPNNPTLPNNPNLPKNLPNNPNLPKNLPNNPNLPKNLPNNPTLPNNPVLPNKPTLPKNPTFPKNPTNNNNVIPSFFSKTAPSNGNIPTFPKTQETNSESPEESSPSLVKTNDKDGEGKKGPSVGFITAISGGTVVGAASMGIFFMRKKNPKVFKNVRRSICQGANTIKRKVSRKEQDNSNDYYNNNDIANYYYW